MTALAVQARPSPSPGGAPVVWSGYEVNGRVRIRVADATRRDLASVQAQIGLNERLLHGQPDITIRFVDQLALTEPVHFVGLDAGYSGNRFLVLRGKHKRDVLVDMPMDEIGGPCEITCQRGITAVPFLVALINLTVLAKGALPVHASAFRHAGRGVLVAGWSKAGKTEALLGFAANGAEYVGDEWIYVDGERMGGIPEPIRMWDWHLQQVPWCWRRLPRSERARLRVLRGAAAAVKRLHWAGATVSGWAHRVEGVIDSQRYTHVPPRAMFRVSGDAPLDRVIFAATHASAAVRVSPADPLEIAERLAVSLEEERAPLMACYRRFRYAFPGRRNPYLERAGEVERDRLRLLLSGRDCFVVHHPYPPSIATLCAALRPIVEQ